MGSLLPLKREGATESAISDIESIEQRIMEGLKLTKRYYGRRSESECRVYRGCGSGRGQFHSQHGGIQLPESVRESHKSPKPTQWRSSAWRETDIDECSCSQSGVHCRNEVVWERLGG
jgi:hypothetical protein